MLRRRPKYRTRVRRLRISVKASQSINRQLEEQTAALVQKSSKIIKLSVEIISSLHTLLQIIFQLSIFLKWASNQQKSVYYSDTKLISPGNIYARSLWKISDVTWNKSFWILILVFQYWRVRSAVVVICRPMKVVFIFWCCCDKDDLHSYLFLSRYGGFIFVESFQIKLAQVLNPFVRIEILSIFRWIPIALMSMAECVILSTTRDYTLYCSEFPHGLWSFESSKVQLSNLIQEGTSCLMFRQGEVKPCLLFTMSIWGPGSLLWCYQWHPQLVHWA